MTKAIRILIQVSISILFLYLALKNLHFEDAKKVFNTMNISFLILGTGLHFSSFFVRAYRWKLLMKPIKSVQYPSVFKILSVSYAANNVIPLRAGDFLRGVMIGNKENISKVSSFSTVMLERVADGITLLCFLSIGLILSNIEIPWMTEWIIFSLVILFGTISILVLFLYYKNQFINSIEGLIRKKSEKLANKVTEMLGNILSALNIIKSWPILLRIVITSFIVWGLEGSIFSFGALALGMTILEAIFIGIVCVSIVNLGTMIPSSPGYIGTFEYFTIFALSLFGISNHMAASYSILIHILQYAPITIVGCLLWLSLDMKYLAIKKDVEV